MDKFQNYCLKMLNEIREIIKMADRDIAASPPGTLHVTYKGKTVQYYRKCDEGNVSRKYIRRSDEAVAQQLAQKEYAKKVLLQAEFDKRKLEKALKIGKIEDYISCYNEMTDPKKKFVVPYVIDDNDYIAEWENDKKRSKSEGARYIMGLPDEDDAIITEKGETVRSKSEKIIADKLFMMKIPYVYEVPVLLKEFGYVNPDFTVLNVLSREEYYWEHFGLMDDSSYCEKAVKKIEAYEKNGIFPGRKLITTYETMKHPLHTRIIQGVIEEYLLGTV